jgi:hypothetical protein
MSWIALSQYFVTRQFEGRSRPLCSVQRTGQIVLRRVARDVHGRAGCQHAVPDFENFSNGKLGVLKWVELTLQRSTLRLYFMKKTQVPLEVLWTTVLDSKKALIFFMNDVGKLDRGQIDGLTPRRIPSRDKRLYLNRFQFRIVFRLPLVLYLSTHNVFFIEL